MTPFAIPTNFTLPTIDSNHTTVLIQIGEGAQKLEMEILSNDLMFLKAPGYETLTALDPNNGQRIVNILHGMIQQLIEGHQKKQQQQESELN